MRLGQKAHDAEDSVPSMPGFIPSSDFLGQLNPSFLVQQRWNGAAPEDGRSLSASARGGPHRRARAHWPTVCPRTPRSSEAGPGESYLVLDFSHRMVLELPGSPPKNYKHLMTLAYAVEAGIRSSSSLPLLGSPHRQPSGRGRCLPARSLAL